MAATIKYYANEAAGGCRFMQVFTTFFCYFIVYLGPNAGEVR